MHWKNCFTFRQRFWSLVLRVAITFSQDDFFAPQNLNIEC